MPAPVDIATLKYEEALAELESLIARLERGDVALDEAVACYQRGSALAQRCAELLDRTEATVMQLVVGAGGADEERPLRALEDDAGARAARPAGGMPALDPVVRAERPMAPPPPGSPARARSVPAQRPTPPSIVRPAPAPAPQAEPPTPNLFPGLDRRPREQAPGADDGAFDLDDIPF